MNPVRKCPGDKKKSKKKPKDKEAQDFSDLSEDAKPKGKKKKAERDRTPPQDFSDMDSDEFKARTKKGKKAASDEPVEYDRHRGSGKRKKVRRRKDSEEQGRKTTKETRKRRREDDSCWQFCCAVLSLCFRSAGASAVLLTTHSMEEAEALSNRLGIMANGQLLTVGTAQQIKAKHGSCHELMLRLRPETEEALSNMTRQWPAQLDSAAVGKILESDAWKRAAYARPRCIVRLQLEQSGVANGEKVEKFLSRLLGDRVELAEDFGIYWRFRLPRSGLSIPQLFQQLEDNAEKFGVAEYTLSQATLEQIFNSITEGLVRWVRLADLLLRRWQLSKALSSVILMSRFWLQWFFSFSRAPTAKVLCIMALNACPECDNRDVMRQVLGLTIASGYKSEEPEDVGIITFNVGKKLLEELAFGKSKQSFTNDQWKSVKAQFAQYEHGFDEDEDETNEWLEEQVKAGLQIMGIDTPENRAKMMVKCRECAKLDFVNFQRSMLLKCEEFDSDSDEVAMGVSKKTLENIYFEKHIVPHDGDRVSFHSEYAFEDHEYDDIKEKWVEFQDLWGYNRHTCHCDARRGLVDTMWSSIGIPIHVIFYRGASDGDGFEVFDIRIHDRLNDLTIDQVRTQVWAECGDGLLGSLLGSPWWREEDVWFKQYKGHFQIPHNNPKALVEDDQALRLLVSKDPNLEVVLVNMDLPSNEEDERDLMGEEYDDADFEDPFDFSLRRCRYTRSPVWLKL
eukprot:s2043_g7.t2